MKTKLSLILGGMLLICHTAMAQGNVVTISSGGSQAYVVKANVPVSSSIGITASQVTTAGNVFSPNDSTTLDFGTLTYTTTGTPPINVFLPTVYYALDIAVQGAGAPDTLVSYTEGLNPNGSTNGLGTKSMITYAKEVFSSSSNPIETVLTSPYQPATLGSLSSAHIPSTQVAGGWLRTYLGVCTGNPSTDASNCHPFTAADTTGQYSGTLTFTVTVK